MIIKVSHFSLNFKNIKYFIKKILVMAQNLLYNGMEAIMKFFYNFKKIIYFITIFLLFIVFLDIDINATQIMYCQLPSEDIVLNSIGIDSAYYNPANLGIMSYNEVKLTHLSYIADIGVESIALGYIFNKYSGCGITLNYMHTEMEYNRDGYIGTKDEKYLSGKLSYGCNIRYGILIGIGIKYGLDISESPYKLPPFSAIDIGITFSQFLPSEIVLEFFMENLISYSSELSIGRNLAIYSGILYRFYKYISCSVGYQYIRYVPDIFSIGLQLNLSQLSKVELGYKFKNNEMGNFFDNAYMGIDVEYQKYRIGYGINPMIGFEETIHKFSIGFVF